MDKRVTKQIRDLDHLIRANIQSDFDLRKVLNYTQFQMLHYLVTHKTERVCQKDLESETHLNKASITSSIDDLERKGIVKRVQSDLDKRKNYIELTSKAKQAKKDLDNNLDKIENKLIQDISDKDLEIFFKVVDKMNKNLRG